MNENVLIIGSGGREHALAWKLAQSPHIGKLYVAPGNGGTRQIAENVAIEATDINGLVQFAEKNEIGLTVVGPDDPLALGIVDTFRARRLRIFGPTRAAAEIESSKSFAKKLMSEAGVPTAPFRVFRKHDEALAYVREHGVPVVIKASGLALGKGVYVCKTLGEAEIALAEIMIDSVHKEAGSEVVVEEFLDGQEISIHAFCDGKAFVLLPPAQDHKPIHDSDKGKNTGGMGSVVPVPWVSADMLEMVASEIVRPTLDALVEHEKLFSGLLYPGIKMKSDGLKVLEFNARFGDPETQSYVRLLKTDLLDILEACVDGTLAKLTIEWHSGFAVCVVLASHGYPDEYKKGVPIYGMSEAGRVAEVEIFHAGTSFDNELRTYGGRVLGVTAVHDTLRGALDRAYEAVKLIKFDGMQYRTDIGAKALAFDLEQGTTESMSYASAGVNYDVIDPFKRMAQLVARETAGNITRLNDGEFREVGMSRGESVYLIEAADSYLAHVEEGLGTKNLIADAMYQSTGKSYYDHIAQDTVAMIVNDMITLGALPLSVAMHLATGDSSWFSDEKRCRDLVRGWKNACDLARCVWGGGETPTLKGVIMPETVVLSGSAMGMIKPKERLISANNIQHGDAIIFIESLGIHANGLTIARKVAEKLPNGYLTRLTDGRTYGETLLDPTHIYVAFIESCLERGVNIHYAVNITGHGWRKLMRATQSFAYVIERLPKQLPIFDFLQEHGLVDDKEAYGNFNMGAGFAIYIAEADVNMALEVATSHKLGALRAGYVEQSDEKKVIIKPKGIEYPSATLGVR